MQIRAIFANLSCSDLAASDGWYAALFGRPADAQPMAGLLEWHFGDRAGVQVFENALSAGQGTLTLIVQDLDGEVARLGLSRETVTQGEAVRIARLRDPDGNLVVLAEPAG